MKRQVVGIVFFGDPKIGKDHIAAIAAESGAKLIVVGSPVSSASAGLDIPELKELKVTAAPFNMDEHLIVSEKYTTPRHHKKKEHKHRQRHHKKW